jgi:hypothetical protein
VFAVVVFASAVALAGCGSSGGGATGPTLDASIDVHVESGSAESGPAASCGTVAPSGTQIVASTTALRIQGVTLDGKGVLYEDPVAQVLYAAPVAGGTPTKLGAAAGTVSASGASGALFFPGFEDAGQPQAPIGPLWAWTAATGAHEVSASATAGSSFDMSSDDAFVVYFATTDGLTGTLTVSTVDGATRAPLVRNVDLRGACAAVARFDKTTVLASYCLTNPGDAAAGDAIVSTFAAPTFTRTSIGSFPYAQALTSQLATNAAGTQILLVGPSGLSLYPTDGGAPVAIDANGVRGLFAPNDDVVYATASGALIRHAAAGGNRTTLLASGSYTPQRISPDGSWLQLYDDLSPMGQYPNVYVASAVTPGMATTEWSATPATLLGFTADSAFEIFEASTGTLATADDLYASPVSSGAAPAKVVSTTSVAVLGGSRLVATDNPAGTAMADIEVFDLSNPAKKTTVVTRAGARFAVTPGGASIVYSWSCKPTSQAGIWVAPSR